MQTYQGYFESGKFIPLDDVEIPDRTMVIITVLDDIKSLPEVEQPKERELSENALAWREFFEAIKDCDEEIPEFERIKLREVEV